MRIIRLGAVTAGMIVAALIGGAEVCAQTGQDYYKGKQITLTIGYGPAQDSRRSGHGGPEHAGRRFLARG